MGILRPSTSGKGNRIFKYPCIEFLLTKDHTKEGTKSFPFLRTKSSRDGPKQIIGFDFLYVRRGHKNNRSENGISIIVRRVGLKSISIGILGINGRHLD
jgi:hypothetical protein